VCIWVPCLSSGVTDEYAEMVRGDHFYGLLAVVRRLGSKRVRLCEYATVGSAVPDA
jgi:hypothetical protein